MKPPDCPRHFELFVEAVEGFRGILDIEVGLQVYIFLGIVVQASGTESYDTNPLFRKRA